MVQFGPTGMPVGHPAPIGELAARDIYVSAPHIVQAEFTRTEMGAHAFQDQVEGLAAATLSRSLAMPKRAEILTMHRASAVRPIAKLTDRIWALRSGYLVAIRELPEKYAAALRSNNQSELMRARDTLAGFAHGLSTPTLIDRDGDDSVAFLEGVAATWAKNSSDDGRYLRRLAKKLRQAGDACDVQRVKLYPIVLQMVEEMSGRLEPQPALEAPPPPDRNKYDALFARTISQYPVITAHLAR